MKNRIASVMTCLGVLCVLLLGAAGIAQAMDNPDYTCGTVVTVQFCDNDVDVPVDIDVTITSPRALTGTEMAILAATLKAITDADVTACEIKATIVDLYVWDFNIPIDMDDVIVPGPPCLRSTGR